MAKTLRRKKRSKLTTVLLSPVLIIVFMAGWSLAYIGQSKLQKANQPEKPTNNTTTKKEEVELVFISNHEEQIRAN